MQYLSVKNLSKSYSHKALFDGVDFTISEGQKIAIVAKNGAGKSTLLKVLMDEVVRSDGDIEFNKKITVGYLSQSEALNPDMTVIEAIYSTDNESIQILRQYYELTNTNKISSNNFLKKSQNTAFLEDVLVKMEEYGIWDQEVRIQTIISKLGITPYLYQKVGSLSGGEAKRVGLAKVLANDFDLLILDEPTNHLDLQMIERLQNYLQRNQATLLMVTHDRYFLESICTDIRELDRGRIRVYPGNYSYFLTKKAILDENEKIEMRNMEKMLKKELERIRKAPRARESKSIKRQKDFYDIESVYDSRKAILQEENIGLELASSDRRLGSKIVKLHNVFKSYGDKKIIEKFSYDFKAGERIGIVGKNGVGKSTFLKILMQQEDIDSGKIQVGETVVRGHYHQNYPDFPDNKRVIDIIKDVAEFVTINNEKITASKLLERFLFPADQQHKFAKSLSGGELKRLHLLTILMRAPNFLILDEPTNDLDIIAINVLENFLLQFSGCLIVVSHDRFFMDRIIDHLFVFEGDGKIRDILGGAYESPLQTWLQELSDTKESKESKISQSKDTVVSDLDSQSGNLKKLSYNEKKELQTLESDLARLDDRKREINLKFEDPNLSYTEINELSLELGNLIKDLEIKENRRLELSERL